MQQLYKFYVKNQGNSVETPKKSDRIHIIAIFGGQATLCIELYAVFFELSLYGGRILFLTLYA